MPLFLKNNTFFTQSAHQTQSTHATSYEEVGDRATVVPPITEELHRSCRGMKFNPLEIWSRLNQNIPRHLLLICAFATIIMTVQYIHLMTFISLRPRDSVSMLSLR